MAVAPYSSPISIHAKGTEVLLPQGRYRIYILGGWYVAPRQFSMRLIRQDDSLRIKLRRAQWPVQSFKFGRQAKRYYEFRVNEKAVYNVVFRNAETLIVKHNNVFPFYFLLPARTNKELCVCIVRYSP